MKRILKRRIDINWEAIGSIGEIIGALAVLATLYYLAAHIKMQNRELENSNEHVRAQLAIDVNNAYVSAFDIVLRDPDFAAIYEKGLASKALNEVDNIRFAQFINRFMAHGEAAITVAGADLLFSGKYEEDFL